MPSDFVPFQGPPPPPFILIHAYTRAQALEDGVLVDASDLAREAGFAWPLALTAAAWALIEAIPPRYAFEDRTGRLWDVLSCARARIQAAPPGEGQLQFDTLLHTAQGDQATFKIMAGPGDQGEPVLTIMLPDED